MTHHPKNLAKLQRARLRAQADMFSAVASHGTIIGTAREIALVEFLRGLIPRRFEILSGAIASTLNGDLAKATSQLDVLVVDTLDYPTLLRAGDLAVVLPASVRGIVESKSDLAKGDKFEDAMQQIGQARMLTDAAAFTALFCFGAPTKSSTLREWLQDLVLRRAELYRWAIEPSTKPKSHDNWTKDDLLARAGSFSAANLPNVVVADDGAIAIRDDKDGKTHYDFYETIDKAPSVVALASSVLAHISLRVVPSGSPQAAEHRQSFQLLVTHFESSLQRDTNIDRLEVTDAQPEEDVARNQPEAEGTQNVLNSD